MFPRTDTAAARRQLSRGIPVSILIVTAVLCSPAFADRGMEPTVTPPVVTVRGASGNPWAFAYNAESQRLGCYESTQTGLERRGVRKITWDLMLEELSPQLAERGVSATQLREAMRRKHGDAADKPTAGKRPTAISAVLGAQSDPWVFIYNASSKRLACYRGGNQGLELRGARRVTWDLKLPEFTPARGSGLPMAEVRRRVEGQETGTGPATLVTSRDTQGRPMAFLYDPESERLAAYTAQRSGIVLSGVRQITWDRRLPGTAAIAAAGPTVAAARKHVEKSASPDASGPSAAGKVTLATNRDTGLNPVVLVHDSGSNRLLRYRVRARGIELRAVRDITGDLQEAETAAPAGD